MTYSTTTLVMRESTTIWMPVVNMIFYVIMLMTQTHNHYTMERQILVVQLPSLFADIAVVTTVPIALTKIDSTMETLNAVVSKSAEALQV